MTDSSSSARVARSLRQAATRSRRTVHRAATAGLTAAFLLSIVGPAAVLASPIVAEGFDDAYAVAKNVQLIESSDTGVLANDTGGYANLVSAPDHGFLNLATNGSFTYEPNPDFVGVDTFTYQACLNASVCDLSAATVTITVANTAPVAVADPVTVLEDSSANVIDAMANDTDTNSDALHFAAIHQPSNGLVTVVGSGSEATLRYTPTSDFHGTDTFTYSVSDSNLNSPLGTVTVTVGNVNDAPSFSAGEDVIVLEDADAYSATWATSISDGPGDTDEVSFVVTNDENGLFATQPAISASGVLSFLMAANANGVATVEATIHDDGGTTNGGVASGTSLSFTITATAQNDGPSCGTDTALLDEDETASGELSLLCTDIDSNLTYTLLDVTGDGDVTVDPDGSWVYTPPENTSGSDSFEFRATDGTVPYDGSVSLTIAAINDGPTFTLAEEELSVSEDAAAQIVSDFLTGVSPGPEDELSQILSIDVTNDASELFLVQPTISLETGALQFTPAADAHGSALVSVTVSDDGPAHEPDEASDTRTFTITVDSINDAPAGVADVYGVDEDGVLTVVAAGTVSILGIGIEAPDGVLSNDTDVDEDALSVVGNTEASHGTVGTVDADGSFTYTPDPDYNGSDSFTYTITDGTLIEGRPVASDPISVTIIVEPINDAPVGVVHGYNVAEDGLLSVSAPGLLVGSSDLEDGTIVVLDYTYPHYGDLESVEPDGQFAYSPDPDFHGTDTFEYWMWDGTAESEHYLVTITVTPVDDPVTAVADSKDVIEDTATVIDVLGNDIDPDADAIRVASVGAASHGTLTIPVGGLNVRYTPDDDYHGSDSFTYYATDGIGSPTSATVTVTVLSSNDAPTFSLADTDVSVDEDAVAQSVSDFLDPSSVGPANESTQTLSVDATNDHNEFFSVQPWIEASTGTLEYTVEANAYGSATVSVTATDNGGTANDGDDTTTKTFTITIHPINDAPTFTLIGDQDTDEDSAAQSVTDFMYPSSVGPGEGSPETMSVDVTNDANDLFSVQPTISPLTGTLGYTVAENANGAATVTVTATDTGGTANDGDDSTTDTFTITIDAINDAPVGVADAYTVAEDGVLSVATTYGFTILDSDAPAVVLANDTDVDLDSLTVASNTEAEHGTVGTVAEDGSFTYTPDADFNGVDGFTYTVTDGTATSEAVTVTITVDAVNDAPVGVADDYSVDEDTVLAVLAADGLVDNDTDVDLDTLTVASNTEAEHGTVGTVAEDGSFSYTPDADFHGEDTFTYTMTDGTATSDAVTITITVDSINDAPVGVANAYDVNEDAVLTVLAVDGLVANDTDADMDTLTVVSKTAASHGTVGTVPANGSFTYTPAANFNGTDTFTYTMTDGTTTSGSITVTITVNAVNDAPVGVANRFFATEDVVLTVLALNGPLANDTDVDLDTLTVVSQSAASHGTVSTIAADGSFTYTPDANFNGTDNFIYRISDGTVTSGPIAIQVVTSAVNDAPNAVNDTGSVAENGPATSYNVLTNDTDVEGNALLLTHVSVSSTAGTVAIVAGQARFTPHILFWGAAVISYTVSDQHGGTDVGTLTVSVSRDVLAPVATTPVVTIGSGSIVSRVPIAVAWSATDVGVGVTQFQVQISTDGLAFTSLYTGTATTTTASLLGGHAYRFRVRAVDAEGNVGGYQTTVSSTLAVALWSNSAITYRVGAWDTFSPTGAHAYAYSATLNDSASYTFTGREIVWVGPKSARSGTANVYIDGVKVSTVSLYRASGLSGQQLFKRTFSSTGVHTIKIVVAQAGKWVSLDEFVVLR